MSDNGPLSLKKVKEHFGKVTYDQVPPRQWVFLLAGSWECSALHGTDPARQDAGWAWSSKPASCMGSRTRQQLCRHPCEDCLDIGISWEDPSVKVPSRVSCLRCKVLVVWWGGKLRSEEPLALHARAQGTYISNPHSWSREFGDQLHVLLHTLRTVSFPSTAAEFRRNLRRLRKISPLVLSQTFTSEAEINLCRQQ